MVVQEGRAYIEPTVTTGWTVQSSEFGDARVIEGRKVRNLPTAIVDYLAKY